jgi:hypothetical protein
MGRQDGATLEFISTCENAVSGALRWVVSSGIQIRAQDGQVDGGFAAWYDLENQTYPFVYSEITGYMLTLLCAVEALHANSTPTLTGMARLAGDWLLRAVWNQANGFACLRPLDNRTTHNRQALSYAFDNGVIINGLCNLYRRTGLLRYLDAAVSTADWLVCAAQRADGLFEPVFDAARGVFISQGDTWSQFPGSYQAKIAIGLLNLFDLTHQERLVDAAERVCTAAVNFQTSDGRLATFPDAERTNCHAMAYAAEGLWSAGTYLGRQDYLCYSLSAVKWLLDNQSSSGQVARHFHHNRPYFVDRFDITAQALRLALLLRTDGRLDAYDDRVDRLCTLLVGGQLSDRDPAADGAFVFGRASDGRVLRHANTWVTAFAIQAIRLYADRDTPACGLPSFELV